MSAEQIAELMKLLTIVPIFGIALFLAFAIEALVEYVFGTATDKIPALTPYKWCLMYISIVVGIILAFAYHLDFVNMLAQVINVMVPASPPAIQQTAISIPVSIPGQIITGIFLSRGANWIHDKLFPKKPEPPLLVG